MEERRARHHTDVAIEATFAKFAPLLDDTTILDQASYLLTFNRTISESRTLCCVRPYLRLSYM